MRRAVHGADLMARLRVLVDENSDGLIGPLREKGYTVESVRELKAEDKRMGHDYNVMNYAKEKGMVLVTRDAETARGCRDNQIGCVSIDEEAILKIVLDKLDRLEAEG